MLHRVGGDLARTEECYQQALELARAIASMWDEAHALAGLGRCAMADGDATQAETLRQALEIFQEIGAAEAPGVLAEVDSLTSKAPQDKPWPAGMHASITRPDPELDTTTAEAGEHRQGSPASMPAVSLAADACHPMPERAICAWPQRTDPAVAAAG